MYAVEAMNGPLDGKRWPFTREITVGRDASAVTVSLPTDRAVSRSHALIRTTADGFELLDLASSNGTFVAGEPIAQPVRIALGQPFVVGRTMLCVLEIADNHAH